MQAGLLRGAAGIIVALLLMETTLPPGPGAAKETRNFAAPPAKDSKVEQPLAAPSADMASRLRIGASIFRQYCVVCHGIDGKGTQVRRIMPPLPDFTRSAFRRDRSDARLLVSILHGRGTFMPANNSRVTLEQAGCLVAFVRTFEPPSDKVGAKDQAGKKPVPLLIRAQLEWLELQKRYIEEQLLEQIQQLEQDKIRQIAQLRQQAQRQTELLNAQEKLFRSQAESQLAQTGSPTANAAGRPPAIAEKLDKILDRLENIERRSQMLEKDAPKRRDK
jgi:mono/diheme cytochrome c family protein